MGHNYESKGNTGEILRGYRLNNTSVGRTANWMKLTQDVVRWWTFLNAVMKLLVLLKKVGCSLEKKTSIQCDFKRKSCTTW